MRERVETLDGTFHAGPGGDDMGVRITLPRRRRPMSDEPTDSPVTVLLADDQAMVRAGFRMIIDSQPDMTVIAEADNGRSAVERPNGSAPTSASSTSACRASTVSPPPASSPAPMSPNRCRVVIATTFDSDEYVEIALRNGAAGFILKESGPQLLLEAVRAAAAGDALISPSITVRYLAPVRRPSTVARRPEHPLSERELDVAHAVARGLGNQEIATELYISLSTVKTHLTSIQTKLGLRNRVEIAIWVIEHLPTAAANTQLARDRGPPKVRASADDTGCTDIRRPRTPGGWRVADLSGGRILVVIAAHLAEEGNQCVDELP